MRRHVKASTAGSTQRQAKGLGRFFRGADATRGGSRASKGSGAPAARRLVVPAAVLAALLALVLAGSASATKIHLFSSSFGASGSGSGQFSANKGIAIDQSDGSVYVVDSGNFRVQKFDASGDFVLAFGKGVDQTNPGDVCTAVSTDTCKAGTQGSGGSGFDTNNGFSNPTFVAIDPNNGDVYVADSGTNVVDKFSSAGAFISSNDGSGSGSAFGSLAGIATDSSRNLWAYDTGGQMREFSNTGAFVTQWNSGFGVGPYGIAVDSATNLYVVRGFPAVQKFSSTGTNLGEVDGSGTATSLAIDPGSNDLYVGATSQVNHFPAGCTPPCSPLEGFGSGDITNAAGVAVRGSTGTAYVSDPGKPAVEIFSPLIIPTVTTGSASNIEPTSATFNGTVNPEGIELTECKFEYGKTTGYGQSAPCAQSTGAIGSGNGNVPVSANVSGLELGANYHFRLVAKNVNGAANGSDATFKLKSTPVIEAQWARSVTFTEATLEGRINPENSATTFHIDYGTTASYGQSTAEEAVASDQTAHTVSAILGGLQPATKYHYRVVATNAVGSANGVDQTFTTFAHIPQDTGCSNQAFRVGFSASLPDCRSYEMVSPVDKNGSDILAICNVECYRTQLDQSSIDGEKLTFSSYKSFAGAAAAPYSSQYLSDRSADGWVTSGINLPRDEGMFFPFRFYWDLEVQFKAFTGDLSTAWVMNDNAKALTPEAAEGNVNLYSRNNIDSTYQALTINHPPPGSIQFGESMLFEGQSKDGSHAVFQAPTPLLPGAPSNGLYDYSDGELHLVSILPDGTPVNGGEIGFYGYNFISEVDKGATREHAVSDDGSRMFWTRSGNLYVRIDNERTVPIATGGEFFFRSASADGSRVIFDTNENQPYGGYGRLYEFNVDTETPSLIAGEERGVLGASEDLSHIYFVSKENLAAGATAGGNNLYVDHNGDFTYITTLSEQDVGQTQGSNPLNVVSREPIFRPSRVTPDGRHIAFESNLSLTGFDNTDAVNGKPDIEVFVYDADSGNLICVSCNQSGSRPIGDAARFPYTANDQKLFTEPSQRIWAAAWLPTSENALYTTRPLADNGQRLIFNSFDPLVPHDNNSRQDVYEWEAQGIGSCEDAKGCISLISSGESPQRSEFIDADPSGKNVFFETKSSLLPQDPGLIDIYDARADGGFTPPPAPPTPCVGDACQKVPQAPLDPTPASANFKGAGDPSRSRGRKCGVPARRAAELARRATSARREAARARSQKRQSALRERASVLAKKTKALNRNANRCRKASRRAGR